MLLCLAAGCLGARLRRAELAVLREPNNVSSWVRLADARQRMGDRQAAREAFQRAAELGGSGSMGEGWTKEEIQRFTLAAPSDDEVWGDAGDMLMALGEEDEARAAYERAMNLDPADAEWHRALAQLGDIDTVHEVALEHLNTLDDESVGDYADLLASFGREEEACEYYRQALELDPSDDEWRRQAVACGFEDLVPPPPEMLGYYADTGLPGGIMESGPTDIPGMESALQSDTSLLVRLGRAYALAGDRAKAEEHLRGALLLDPVGVEALDAYMAVTGRSKKAVLEGLLDDVPDNDELFGELGDHYIELGQRSQALKWYRRAHDLDENDPEWRTKVEMLEALLGG